MAGDEERATLLIHLVYRRYTARRVENRCLPFIPGAGYHYQCVRGTTPQTDNEFGSGGHAKIASAGRIEGGLKRAPQLCRRVSRASHAGH